MIAEEIIRQTEEDELFSIFHKILYRINLERNKDYPDYIENCLLVTDKEIIKAVRWSKEDLK